MLPSIPKINRLTFEGAANTNRGILSIAPNASMWGVRDMTGGTNPRVMKVYRSISGSGSNYRDFQANEIEDGTLLSWVTEGGATADGFVNALYDQSDRGFHWFKDEDFNAPKIVINGALSLDSENKLAINGNGAKLRLGADNSTVNTNFFSSDGTWSLFLVTDFPNYSGATNANVQIIHFESDTNGGANSPRKPVIACNKSFNQLSVAQPTQTVGSDTIGNIFLPTYPGEQLFSSFGNPSLAENNNEGFLDGVGRGATGHKTTNLATAVNTDTDAPGTKNVLFMQNETGVTTFLSGLIYAPSYLFSAKTEIENELVNLYDITFVDE
tara:strand:- start:220 stop:1197 length:978 start_codon:yes stop_codon:yes gene_type:complete